MEAYARLRTCPCAFMVQVADVCLMILKLKTAPVFPHGILRLLLFV